mmetsp:Transcript_19441/g.29884  ORF Transcript_19441/g.29884 Transcript_19441/m.29884 type:complete len:198 (-) Transcript_19441:1357-1950(-)
MEDQNKPVALKSAIRTSKVGQTKKPSIIGKSPAKKQSSPVRPQKQQKISPSRASPTSSKSSHFQKQFRQSKPLPSEASSIQGSRINSKPIQVYSKKEIMKKSGRSPMRQSVTIPANPIDKRVSPVKKQAIASRNTMKDTAKVTTKSTMRNPSRKSESPQRISTTSKKSVFEPEPESISVHISPTPAQLPQEPGLSEE